VGERLLIGHLHAGRGSPITARGGSQALDSLMVDMPACDWARSFRSKFNLVDLAGSGQSYTAMCLMSMIWL
jgi:hypothetical protein